MKNYFGILLILFCPYWGKSQVLIAKWTFPTGTAVDSLADGGISTNLTKAFSSSGTSAIDFSKNGFSTKAAQATDWDNGKGTKYWMISFSTKGYDSINISSKQQSGGNNPGPRDFKLQFKIGDDDEWTDAPGGNIQVMNDWTTGNMNDLFLPDDCFDEDSVFVRWLVNSDTNSSGAVTVSNGISKIDDIFVYGKSKQSTSFKTAPDKYNFIVFPNPFKEQITLSSNSSMEEIQVFDLSGNLLFQAFCKDELLISIQPECPSGIYLLRIGFGEKVEPGYRVILKQ
jgi:hypothetical protein